MKHVMRAFIMTAIVAGVLPLCGNARFPSDGEFRIGCNYWASHAGMKMWSRWNPAQVEDIPLGAMIPKSVPHLLVAGRAVSSDHGANSALRVRASCMAIGQSAGVVAALAAQRGIDPREVGLEDAKRQLRAIGAIVP